MHLVKSLHEFIKLLADGIRHAVAVCIRNPARANTFEALVTEEVHGEYEILPDGVRRLLLVAPPRLDKGCGGRAVRTPLLPEMN